MMHTVDVCNDCADDCGDDKDTGSMEKTKHSQMLKECTYSIVGFDFFRKNTKLGEITRSSVWHGGYSNFLCRESPHH